MYKDEWLINNVCEGNSTKLMTKERKFWTSSQVRQGTERRDFNYIQTILVIISTWEDLIVTVKKKGLINAILNERETASYYSRLTTVVPPIHFGKIHSFSR